MAYQMADIFDVAGVQAPGGGQAMPDPLSWLWGGYYRPTMNQALGGLLSPGGGMPGNPYGVSFTAHQPSPPPGVLAPPAIPPTMPPVVPPQVPPADPFTPPGGGGLAPPGPQGPMPQQMMPRGPMIGRGGGRDPRGGGGGSGGLGGGGVNRGGGGRFGSGF